MIDRIDALEEKMTAVLEKVHEAKAKISELQRHNRELIGLLEQKEQTDSDNSRLQGRIRELEQELNNRDDRENTVKDRLKMILNRIDTLESEILELDNNQVE